MKKIMSVVVLIALGLALIPSVYGQDVEVELEEGKTMPQKMQRMMKHHMMKDKVTPEQLAGYDEATKAAWREIESVRIKGRHNPYLAITAAFAIAIAVFGGALAQGRVASSAMEGIARNPEASSKLFTPLIISLALIESLVIYALVIAFLLQGKM